LFPQRLANVLTGQSHNTRIISKDRRLSEILAFSGGDFQTHGAAQASNRQEKGSFGGWQRF